MPPPPFSSPHSQSFPALYLYPLNNTFVPKHITLIGGQRVKIGRQTNAKTVPAERNGYFDSKVLSRQHAEVWEDSGKIFIKDVKSSNGTFINGERLSPEGVESEPFELKNDDIVEFGIDIIGEDNKTTIHHKVAARVLCIFTEEDAMDAVRVERMQSPTGITGGPSQPSTSGAAQFSFAQGQPVPPAQRRPTLQSQALGGMGGMGGSMRPPGKSGLSFDHILSRLQSELQKSRETGAELHSLTGAMNDIHDTLGGVMPPSVPHFPSNLPPVRPPQPQPAHEPALPVDSGSVPVSVLSDLRTQLHETQTSLANHVDKVRALEDILAEHDAIKTEVASLRELIDERKRELEVSRFATSSPSGHHDPQHHDDLRNGSYRADDDDGASIHTIVPHALESVVEEEEEEDQLVPEEEEEEDRRRRREELGRPRTPEPTGMGIPEDDEDSPEAKRRHRPSSPPPQSNDTASAAIDELAERLSALSERIDTAVESNNFYQAQHAAAQTTISQLQSKIAELEELVHATHTQLQEQNTAQETAHAEILRAVREPRESERESLTAALNEWKKGIESQWSAVQEEWSQERERLSKVKEEWENRARALEQSLDAKVNAGLVSLTALHRDRFPNGDIKINGGGGLVTPPSPVSVASNPGRTKSRRRRSSSSRSRSRSSSPISSIEMIEGAVHVDHDIGSNPSSRRASDQYQRSRSPSPSIVESEPESCSRVLERGAQYPITPAPSVKDSPEQLILNPRVLVVESKTDRPLRTSGALHFNFTTAVGVIVVGIATAAVLWRVKQE